MTPWRHAAAAIALAGALGACGGEDEGGGGAPPSPTAAADAVEGAVVEMTDELKFEPAEITVSVGERVEWPNVGTVAHTVTTDPAKVADPGTVGVPRGVTPWDSGLIAGGESFSRTFRKPGTYRYLCIPHEGARMVGTVVVKG
jgi:plastocyanin